MDLNRTDAQPRPKNQILEDIIPAASVQEQVRTWKEFEITTILMR
jgi:hypothetical protein